MAMDLLSILQDEKRSFSFLSQSVGLMSDLDLGTDHLRWMGSNRFVYGYLRGGKYCPSAFVPSHRTVLPVLTRKAYRFAISVKTGVLEKGAMVEALREYTSSAPHFNVSRAEEETTTGLPPLRYVDEHDGWTTFEGPILYMYAGKGPFVSR
jgi:sphingosine kinase